MSYEIHVGCSKKFLEEAYKQAENLRLLFWEELVKIQDEMERWNVLKKEDRTVLARAEFDGKVLKIAVDDILPRYVKGIKNSLLRLNWCQSIIEAVEDLRGKGMDPKFEKALCQIVVYHVLNTKWDADNRAFKYIINGLACAKVIPDDAWDKLTIMVTGQVDKDRPRTEIFVMPLEEDLTKPLIYAK